MDHLASRLLEDVKSYLSLKNDYVAIMTEEKMFEYRDSLLKNLHDLPNNGKYKVDYAGEYYEEYDVSQCSSKITSLLIDIIPVEMEVLYICTSKLKESRSTELEGFVKKILKASPRIPQNYLILIQGRMAGELAVSAPTQSINVMMELLLIFLTDIAKHFIHRDKLNDMLVHVGVLTREISILVSKLLESSDTINEEDFSAPGFLQKIEQMKGDLRQIFLRAPESSQLHFPKDDDVAYEAEHVTNSILVRDNALSHLIFSLPIFIDKIKLTVEEVTSLEPEEDITNKNGNQVDAKSSEEPAESNSSSFGEVTVGHEEEAAWIIDQLFDEQESELDVISILRMPRLGKTTLANKKILNQVTGSKDKESAGDKDDLAEDLREALYDKGTSSSWMMCGILQQGRC
ncbi:hypothetical protein HAX54_012095 [Datura stramonium]|uniref:Uncharacterized protein n=1 Tax=Datura stramonium TaxID=4076 RepID=A0ABS8Y0X4_DATST|nr:hypothetical protein [Datura stramonium]